MRMQSVLARHAKRYPAWGLDDVYKLVFQAATGSEHAGTDEVLARAGLARELAEMGPGPDEPLVDPIAGDGSIVRIHLRPFLRRGLDPEALLQAFLRTAREFGGSPKMIESGLREAARLAREGALAFPEADVDSLIVRMRAVGFPAVHHTDAFTSQYRPAYRVIASTFLPRELILPHEADGSVLGRRTATRPT